MKTQPDKPTVSIATSLASTNGADRFAACIAVGQLATPARVQKANLAQLIRIAWTDKSSEVRVVAVTALGLIGTRATGALRAAAVDDQHPTVAKIGHFLGYKVFVAEDATVIVFALQHALRDPDRGVREQAEHGLASIVEMAEVEPDEDE
jgi:HEAT repeats